MRELSVEPRVPHVEDRVLGSLELEEMATSGGELAAIAEGHVHPSFDP